MTEIVFTRLNWDRTGAPFRMPGARWFDLHYGPEPGAPFGRKGAAIADGWAQLAGGRCAGMLVMDTDVVIDPLDYAAMLGAVSAAPERVHVGPVRLWRASLGCDTWVWGHWAGRGPSQEWTDTPDHWTYGFTYLPRALLEAANRASPPMREWVFPGVDMKLCSVAKRRRIKAETVRDCHPKHMHY